MRNIALILLLALGWGFSATADDYDNQPAVSGYEESSGDEVVYEPYTASDEEGETGYEEEEVPAEESESVGDTASY
mgnify:FL=1